MANTAHSKPRICNAKETGVIVAALSQAKKGVQKSLAVIESLNKSSNPHFQRWFGKQGKPAIKSIEGNYLAMLGFADFQTYYCPLKSTEELPFDALTIAAVASVDVTSMYFTPLFFEASTTGVDSQAGVIVHELSHYTLTGDTMDDGDRYGTAAAEERAKQNPALAIKVADNYQYLSEALLYGI